jgi:hypothetical protein
MSDPAKGQHWQDAVGPVRVMAIVEGYVVVRRKGAIPFLRSMRDFRAAFTLATPQTSGDRS